MYIECNFLIMMQIPASYGYTSFKVYHPIIGILCCRFWMLDNPFYEPCIDKSCDVLGQMTSSLEFKILKP